MSTSTKTIKVPEQLTRQGVLSMDDEKKEVSISISSDTPYERYDWWNDERYYEVLDHSPTSVGDSRLKAGLPMLYNHNRNEHLGRAKAYENDGKRITVKDLVWSEDAKAQAKKRDMEAGVLVDTSVGYRLIGDGECIGAKDGIPVYKFKWEPHEFSLVTIPADISVGVGRMDEKPTDEPREVRIKGAQFDKPNEITNKRAMSTQAENPNQEAQFDVTAERNSAVAEYQAKCDKIDGFVDSLKNPQWKEAAREIAAKHKKGAANFDDFRAEALNAFDGVRKVTETAEIGMSDKDIKRFSLMKACRDMAYRRGGLEGFEKEVCETAQRKIGRELTDEKAFVIPHEVSRLHDEMALARMLQQRAQMAGTFSAGGATIDNQFGPLIELLRNKTVLGQLGITMIDGLVGDFILPQQTGGCTAYWVSELGELTDSEATFAQKAMTPHRLGASYPVTKQFLAQTSLSADAFLRNELDTVLALKKDAAGLLGTGTGGEPLGVANTTGINATVTYGGAATWADVVEHETGIAVDNADIGTMAFILSAAAVGKWKTILKDSVAGAGYLLSDTMTANGYPVKRTNQISSASQSFFGVWSQLLHGMWAGREIIVDNITLAKKHQVLLISNELCDFLVRQPLAFNVSTDSAAQ